MKTKIADVVKRTAVIMLPILLSGCVPQASSGATVLQEVPAFIGDFARQMLAALLL
jgi:hypothetical protein